MVLFVRHRLSKVLPQRGRLRTIERTCCICRSKADKRGLLRVVAVNGDLVIDDSQSLPGRGGYVHPTPECLSRMGQVARWERALRVGDVGLKASQVSRVAMELMAKFQAVIEDPNGSSSGSGKKPKRGIRL